MDAEDVSDTDIAHWFEAMDKLGHEIAPGRRDRVYEEVRRRATQPAPRAPTLEAVEALNLAIEFLQNPWEFYMASDGGHAAKEKSPKDTIAKLRAALALLAGRREGR